METRVVNFKSKEAVNCILNNQVVAFPTETVYGLGVVYDSQDSFDELVNVKNRNPDKPFTLMLGNKEDVGEYAEVNENIKKVIDAFMPGEITLLLKPKKNLYPWVTLNSKYIGIRVSGKKEVCDFINEVGKPLLVTSANLANQNPCVNFEETYRVFYGKVPYIIKGETSSSLPSTIVICDEGVSLVRLGNISFEKIKKVWEE